uniref:BRCT domain-containing protein n=1 Tax=Trichobilharzia regenti TaxID=157069 RepID=A0AA85KCD7_TRIRE|nr:unnamed protein product [Trichobilharzia regenti]
MPEIVPNRVVSFTSEDKAFPASNLLKGSSFSKWRCLTGGTKQEAVEFSFSEPVEISRIDIGNNGSAFIEVLVRRSASSEDPSVLLPSSSFMSPVDAKNETNLNRVRVFSGDQFTKSVASQKWDIVKFVCSQPFNKTLQYGISFVFFHTPATSNPQADNNKEIKVDSLISEEDTDSPEFKPGSLFQASRQTVSCSQDSSESKSSVSDKLIAAKQSTNVAATVNTPKPPVHQVNRQNTTPKVSNTVHHQPNQKPVSSSSSSAPSSSASSSSSSRHTTQQPPKTPETSEVRRTAKPSHSTSNKPLSNVIFTLSGYQNPLRSQIRDKALELGAKYRQDWTTDCTHLICAFPNTPKFNTVKGKGIIVSDKWITQCYETKSCVPWRSYRVGRAPSPPNATSVQPPTSNDSDDNDDSQSPPSRSTQRVPSLRMRGGRQNTSDDEWHPNSSDENPDNDDDGDEEWDDEEEEEDGEAEEDNDAEVDSSDELGGRRRKRKRATENKSARKRHRPSGGNNASTEAKRPARTNNPENEDTDDEIQRVMASSNNQAPDNPAAATTTTTTVSDGEQEEVDNHEIERDGENNNDDDDEDDIEQSAVENLPDIFINKHFFIHNKSIPKDEERLIERLIIAFAGTLHQYMNNEVQYVITRSDWDSEFDDVIGIR